MCCARSKVWAPSAGRARSIALAQARAEATRRERVIEEVYPKPTGGEEERPACGVLARSEHVGERVEPEGAPQGAVGFERAVDALGDDMVDVAVGDNGVAVGDHRSEHAVAHLDAKIVQVAC